MNEPESQPEQRHADHSLLRLTLREVAADVAKKLIWAIICGSFAMGIIGFNIWLKQRDIVEATQRGAAETAALADAFKEFRDKQEPYNEKTSIMWHQGEWKRFKAE